MFRVNFEKAVSALEPVKVFEIQKLQTALLSNLDKWEVSDHSKNRPWPSGANVSRWCSICRRQRSKAGTTRGAICGTWKKSASGPSSSAAGARTGAQTAINRPGGFARRLVSFMGIIFPSRSRPVGRPSKQETLYNDKKDIQDYQAPTGTSIKAALEPRGST